MKALSVIQPWATLLALGAKRIETRSYPVSYRGLLALHASKGFPRACIELCFDPPFNHVLHAAGYTIPALLPLGAIIAVARLAHVGRIATDRTGAVFMDDEGDHLVTGNELAFGNYEPGRFGWVMTDVHRLGEPISCKGALGLWDITPAMLTEIRRQTGVPA